MQLGKNTTKREQKQTINYNQKIFSCRRVRFNDLRFEEKIKMLCDLTFLVAGNQQICVFKAGHFILA